jgi:DNA-binding transcriptional LysR family regulator
VEGQLVFNTSNLIVNSALAGMGLASLPSQIVESEVARGRLKQVLSDWCPPFPGYHLYYPSRRQQSPAFRLLVEALRYRG